MEELFRVVAGLLVQKSERLSGAEARFLRKWLGWSWQDTADRLGFTPEHVSLGEAQEPIDDNAAWDARLGSMAKEPLELSPSAHRP